MSTLRNESPDQSAAANKLVRDLKRNSQRLTRAEAKAVETATDYFLQAWETLGGHNFEATAGMTGRQRRALWKAMNSAQDKLVTSLLTPTFIKSVRSRIISPAETAPATPE